MTFKCTFRDSVRAFLAAAMFIAAAAFLTPTAETAISAEKPCDTRLNGAVLNDDLGEAERLLDSGADINATDAFGNTPLLNAVSYARSNMANFLLTRGADPNILNNTGDSALIKAVINGETELVMKLVAARADINYRSDYDGRTALMAAITNTKPDIISFLLSKGASTDIKDNFGETALDMAYDTRNGSIISLFTEKEKQSTVTVFASRPGLPENSAAPKTAAETVLAGALATQDALAAAKSGNAPRIREIILKSENPDIRDEKGRNPLMTAVIYGNTECVSLLASNKIGLADRDRAGNTALDHAVASRNETFISLTARNRPADLSAKLAGAAEKGDTALVRMLVRAGADPSKAAPGGVYPLIAAARAGKTDTAKFLVERGAAANARDAAGKTALDYAAPSENAALISVFTKNGADLKKYVMQYSTSGSPKALEALLKSGAPAEFKADDSRRTPLIAACSHGRLEAVRLLLENGADIRATDREGKTPLMHAAANDNAEIVRLILARDDENARKKSPESGKRNMKTPGKIIPCIDLRDNLGRTALATAAISGNAAMVRILAGKSSDIDIADRNGVTPLMHAIDRGDAGIIKILMAQLPDINRKDASGDTALVRAARKGDKKIIKLLMD